MKSRLRSAAAIIAATFMLVACGPAPMSVDEACNAWHDMQSNYPNGLAPAQGSKYSVKYYEDWAGRTDGKLHEAFGKLAKADRMIIDNNSGSSDELWNLQIEGHTEVEKVCGT
ncbi:hypothetical protein [Arthrobacter wenxiniae]|uniref:Lipoprotein n=1 Tax=Arthrobacter wenxiniae TaxID=2713570 RepID=A0A7Y7LZK9_9MICC|nr:hypothetical protein [Arthrobacter wenxiniae]NVM96097.1 hypothetical protein [Arthrobacter wenxiniae]